MPSLMRFGRKSATAETTDVLNRGPEQGLMTRQKRLLIVEDDPELWPILELYSKRFDPGLKVEVVATSDEAVVRLSCGIRYDAVVTDYCLPRPKDGLRVQKSVSKLQPWSRLGTVTALMGYKSNGIPFLRKPFTSGEYRRFLRDLFA